MLRCEATAAVPEDVRGGEFACDLSLEKGGWFAAPKYENLSTNDVPFASIASLSSLAAYSWLVSNKGVARQHSSNRECGVWQVLVGQRNEIQILIFSQNQHPTCVSGTPK